MSIASQRMTLDEFLAKYAALLFEPPTQSVIDVRHHGTRLYRAADVIDLGDIVPGLSLAVGDLYAAVRFE